jgi:hypothetical protein
MQLWCKKLRNCAACSLMLTMAMAISVQANCSSQDFSPEFESLQVLFSNGDYDEFFKQTNALEFLSDEIVETTNAELERHLGVPDLCVEIFRRSYSESFHINVTAFRNGSGVPVYVYFAGIVFDDVLEVVSLQISSDLNHIMTFVR